MRLPGTCAGCGQRVEARLEGQAEEFEMIRCGLDGRWTPSTRDLPAGWCDPGTWEDHVCVKVPA